MDLPRDRVPRYRRQILKMPRLLAVVVKTLPALTSTSPTRTFSEDIFPRIIGRVDIDIRAAFAGFITGDKEFRDRGPRDLTVICFIHQAQRRYHRLRAMHQQTLHRDCSPRTPFRGDHTPFTCPQFDRRHDGRNITIRVHYLPDQAANSAKTLVDNIDTGDD